LRYFALFLIYLILKNYVTLKSGSGVTQGHGNLPFDSLTVVSWFYNTCIVIFVSEMHHFWDIRKYTCIFGFTTLLNAFRGLYLRTIVLSQLGRYGQT